MVVCARDQDGYASLSQTKFIISAALGKPTDELTKSDYDTVLRAIDGTVITFVPQELSGSD